MRAQAETGTLRADAAGYASAFAATLADASQAVPAGLKGPGAAVPAARFDVYRNNVSTGFATALAELFPATARIVGEEFFRAMVPHYLRAFPPRSRLLAECGGDLAAFVAAFPPLADYPWLSDVVRIEQAWIEAYHAADAEPLAPEALTRVPAELLGELVFDPHPAIRLIRSAFPAATIFAGNRDPAAAIDDTAIDLETTEDTLITRPLLDVIVTRLPPGGAVFLAALVAGDSLAEAAAKASEEDGFDLSANIAGMIAAGAFAGLRSPHGATTGKPT